MLTYLKENGFPMSIWIETADANEENDHLYQSVVKDEDDNIIDKFNHTHLKERVFWAEGFFKGLKFKTNE